LVAPVAKVFVGRTDDGERAFFGDQNEPGWIVKRKRTEKYAVYDAEDGGVCADAERESKNSDRREARAFCEEPEGKANVLDQSEHGFPEILAKVVSMRESTSSFRRMLSTIVIGCDRESGPFEVHGKQAPPLQRAN
jgi:hypothetical protein